MTEEETNNKMPDLVSDSNSNASTLTSKNSYRGRGTTRVAIFKVEGEIMVQINILQHSQKV